MAALDGATDPLKELGSLVVLRFGGSFLETEVVIRSLAVFLLEAPERERCGLDELLDPRPTFEIEYSMKFRRHDLFERFANVCGFRAKEFSDLPDSIPWLSHRSKEVSDLT